MAGNLIGQVLLDQFRVDAFIAAGGMGAVYRVWDLKRSVPLAMKILHAELADDPAVFRRFKREANALKKLAHPNIVPFYGLHEVQDFYFLLEAYINGPTLKDVLKKRGQALPLVEALSYVKALCAALGYAHTNGVVHCDIKPANVMIDSGGGIYLADFGIARHADSTTTTVGGAGTPAYMAPEQIRGEEVTPATDVYALGVMVFELLTGQRPFRGETASASAGTATAAERIRAAHLSQPPPDPRSLNPALPAGLPAVVARAMEKDPRRRFPGAMAFFDALCAAVGVNPASVPDRAVAPGPGVGVPGGDLRQDGSSSPAGVLPVVPKKQVAVWLVGGVAVVLLLLVTVMALRPRMGGSASPVEGAAVSQAGGGSQAEAAVSSEPTIDFSTPLPSKPPTTRPLPSDTPIPSPTPRRSTASTQGEWIAYAYEAEQYNRDLVMRNIYTGEEIALTGNREGNNMPSFSPDGKRLAFSHCPKSTCELNEMSLSNRSVQPVATGSIAAYFPEWCPATGSAWVAFEGRDSSKKQNIWQVNMDTGDLEQLTKGNLDMRPTFSPDCSQIVFERYDPGNHGYSDLFIYDLGTGKETRLVSTRDDDELNTAWSPDGNWIAFGRIRQDRNGDGVKTNKDGPELFIIHPDGSGERNLSNGQFFIFNPSWSPGSDQILFGSYLSEGRFELAIYNLVSGQANSLGLGTGPYYHPVWAP